MKTIDTKKTKIAAIVIAVNLVLLFSSCSTYRNGFIKPLPETTDISSVNPDSVQQRKIELQAQSTEIVAVIDSVKISKQAIPPALLNRLFGNLQAHYQVDSGYHRLLYFAKDDSLKMLARNMLVESAADYHQLFQHNKDLRRLINQGDPAFHIGRNTLLHSQKFLWAPANRELLKQVIPSKPDRQSKCCFFCRKCADNSNAVMYNTVGFFIELFGRSVARIHEEPEPEKNVARLMPYLQKWDIIIQKSPGRLTDRFIPGYFGHAAIYLGDSLFVEGIQDGVITNDPVHFAEGGSFLVIRLKNISEEKDKRIRQLVNGQIGKKYDFNFNVNSPARLFCAELVYFVYEDIKWETERTAGVITISPDNLIRTTLADDRFYFPLFFDEEQLIENPSIAFVQSLLKRDEAN